MMTSPERCAEASAPDDSDAHTTQLEADTRRCWGCRRLWPRTAMRWGFITEGALWNPRRVKVLRCADCLE
jgi:hypothetical protein